jgi:hypothetical protein
MQNDRIIIDYALDSLRELRQAELRKRKLEALGYTLVHEQASLTTGRLIYERAPRRDLWGNPADARENPNQTRLL